jgi:hypothetical protein
VNGDGFDDVVLGVYLVNGPNAAYLFAGAASGPPASPPAVVLTGAPGSGFGYVVE